jgi:hypothetical protein
MRPTRETTIQSRGKRGSEVAPYKRPLPIQLASVARALTAFRWSLSNGLKKFFVHAVQADCEWSFRRFLTQKDRKRHRRSDKIRPAAKSVEHSATASFRKTSNLKCGKTRSFLTESTFRGEALKDRSEGSWRSGRRRSGGCWRRGHGQRFRLFRVVPVIR